MAKKQATDKKKKARSSWDQIKGLVGCHSTEKFSCRKICAFTDVVHGNTKIVHRADKSPELKEIGGGGGGRGMQLRKLSGCYECTAVIDLSRNSTRPRHVINTFPCSQCGEIFPQIEILEFHQTVNHAVSELGADDSSRNIVEIIFKSSWLKEDNSICEIERILKVHNTQRTIQRLEEHRASVIRRANKNASARCVADGNELLRFHAATITCALGTGGSSSLCSSYSACGICTIIRHGFRSSKTSWGIYTTESSGRADDFLGVGSGTRRAALVCRVIAGRVKPSVADDDAPDAEVAGSGSGSYDSCAGANSNINELYVLRSRAILPCFVVIYK